MEYKKGLHVLLNIRTSRDAALADSSLWQKHINAQIEKYKLQKVGEVCHNFAGGGFTAIHGLTESHVSIHTWPEYGLCTCDIFLSNYQKDNHNTVREIGKSVIELFSCTDYDWHEVER
jgi:S-adenosylmethionine decarboxylase